MYASNNQDGLEVVEKFIIFSIPPLPKNPIIYEWYLSFPYPALGWSVWANLMLSSFGYLLGLRVSSNSCYRWLSSNTWSDFLELQDFAQHLAIPRNGQGPVTIPDHTSKDTPLVWCESLSSISLPLISVCRVTQRIWSHSPFCQHPQCFLAFRD